MKLVVNEKGTSANVIVVGVLVVLLIGVAGFLFMRSYKSSNHPLYNPGSANNPVSASTSPSTVSNPGDNSNDALDADLQSVGKQVDDVNTSAGSVDQGLNDQQTDLSSP